MAELLAWLTVVELVVLLLVVSVGVYGIMNSLRRINGTMANISWGVRAIEGETALITASVPPLIQTFTELDAGAKVIAQGLSSAEGHLAAAARLLGAEKGT
jgi:hypothetical protein